MCSADVHLGLQQSLNIIIIIIIAGSGWQECSIDVTYQDLRLGPTWDNDYPLHAVGISQMHWLFELGQRGGDADVVSQKIQRGDQVAPLHQLAQRASAERVFGDFEARLLGQQAQMHQDLERVGKGKWVTLEIPR